MNTKPATFEQRQALRQATKLAEKAERLGLFCLHCKHCMPARDESGVILRDAVQCLRFLDLVTGAPNLAQRARYDEKQCGRKGYGWEPRQPQK